MKALTHDRVGCNNWCINVTAQETLDMAKRMNRVVYTHMARTGKVFQAYPGGRTILRPAIQRYISRAHESQIEVRNFLAGKAQ